MEAHVIDNVRCEDMISCAGGKLVCFMEGRFCVYTVLEWSSPVVDDSFVCAAMASTLQPEAFRYFIFYYLRTHRGGYMGKGEPPKLSRFYMDFNKQGILEVGESVDVPWHADVTFCVEITKWLNIADVANCLGQLAEQKAVE